MKKKRNEIYLQQFLDFSAGFLIVKIVIPETGVLGMVNEGSNAVLFFGIGGSCVWTIIHKRKTNKTAVVFGVLLLVLTLGIGGWISGKLVLDLISGPEVVRLTSVTMRESSGIYGLISTALLFMRKRLTSGRNIRWKFLRMSIMSYEGEEQVTVLCYPRTERILKFCDLPTDIYVSD